MSVTTSAPPNATASTPGIRINGIAHVVLTVCNMERSASFYAKLCEFMGLVRVIDSPEFLYYVGGRTAVGISPADAAFQNQGDKFVQRRVGLHHICFRATSRQDVDALHTYLVNDIIPSVGGRVVHPPQEDGFAPGYYSLLFEDPDGIRLEINYVPGKGLLAKL